MNDFPINIHSINKSMLNIDPPGIEASTKNLKYVLTALIIATRSDVFLFVVFVGNLDFP